MTLPSCKLEPQFRCGECSTLHSQEYQAQECCAPEISEIYMCPQCGSEQVCEEDAFDCCDMDPDAPPPMASPRDRERAGQLRLFPR